MEKQIIHKERYAKLISDLKKMLEEGKKRAQVSVNQIVSETYWHMGKRICDDGLIEESTFAQIARDLELERTSVSRMVKFYQTWPKSVPAGHDLSWSHFKALLTVEDKSEREFYLKESFLKDWSRDDLRQKIKDGYAVTAKAQKEIKSQKAQKLERRPGSTYLYSAIVDRIIDADTFLLRVDLGFNVWINQRIRLRGIDCPEISTPEGQKAKEYVEKRLKNCFTMAIQTFKKIDVHGRYVCDLFYLEGETDKGIIAKEGTFLNQELLDKGLAVLM